MYLLKFKDFEDQDRQERWRHKNARAREVNVINRYISSIIILLLIWFIHILTEKIATCWSDRLITPGKR